MKLMTKKEVDKMAKYEDKVESVLTTTVQTLNEVFNEGRDKNKTDLTKFNTYNHIERAIKHLCLYMENDNGDKHIAHALWRIAVTNEIERGGSPMGITCPRCGSEMQYDGDVVSKNIPMQSKFVCFNCLATLFIDR